MAFPVVFKIGAIVVNTVTKHMAAGLKTFAEEGSEFRWEVTPCTAEPGHVALTHFYLA
jgi:hypothetical protein